jgi:hypothetical protein
MLIQNGSVDKFVVIEADSAKEANEVAEWTGIYFDGFKKGIDTCDSCQDKWERVREDYGYNEPVIGETRLKYYIRTYNFLHSRPAFNIYIYYKNGERKTFSPNDMVNCATKGNK